MAKRKKKSKKFYAGESDTHGTGCFANRKFKKGDVIGHIEAHVVQDPDFQDIHVLTMESGLQLKVTCDLKFINHSSTPNCSYEPDGAVIALTTIARDEELLHDYGEGWE